MNDDTLDKFSYFFTGLALGSMLVAVIAVSGLNINFVHKGDAIAHHAAHYDGKTGKFTWNDEVTK